MEELLDLIPRMTVKKMEQDKETINNVIKSSDADITEVDINSQHDSLRYWDEGDKLRVVNTITLDDVGDELAKVILDDAMMIVCGLISAL